MISKRYTVYEIFFFTFDIFLELLYLYSILKKCKQICVLLFVSLCIKLLFHRKAVDIWVKAVIHSRSIKYVLNYDRDIGLFMWSTTEAVDLFNKLLTDYRESDIWRNNFKKMICCYF